MTEDESNAGCAVVGSMRRPEIGRLAPVTPENPARNEAEAGRLFPNN
jgi:hypothetical protein